MPCVVYYEYTKKNKRQMIWIEKILITTHKDTVVYDGEFKKYDKKILDWIDKYADNPKEFKKKYGIIG